jgi:hypothetical protein
MKGDPKNPNAWWAVKLPSFRETFSMNLGEIPKKRLYWIVPLMIAEVSVVIFFLHMLMK